MALGPVSWLWERLSGWQQDQVQAAAKAELAHLAGLGVAPEGAPRLLADRLTDRLAETGGEAMVTARTGGWSAGVCPSGRPARTASATTGSGSTQARAARATTAVRPRP
ncbi:hypothetical protein ACFVQ4_29440 [Streptomyces laurentii]|uniref:hypothetical protein n=1 Tax=Streptomyces laurentii TaxID=39478 RepID=UPI0036783867